MPEAYCFAAISVTGAIRLSVARAATVSPAIVAVVGPLGVGGISTEGRSSSQTLYDQQLRRHKAVCKDSSYFSLSIMVFIEALKIYWHACFFLLPRQAGRPAAGTRGTKQRSINAIDSTK